MATARTGSRRFSSWTPQAYQRIVEAWAVAHKRRRNLWQALARRKLPLPGKR